MSSQTKTSYQSAKSLTDRLNQDGGSRISGWGLLDYIIFKKRGLKPVSIVWIHLLCFPLRPKFCYHFKSYNFQICSQTIFCIPDPFYYRWHNWFYYFSTDHVNFVSIPMCKRTTFITTYNQLQRKRPKVKTIKHIESIPKQILLEVNNPVQLAVCWYLLC